MFETTFVMYYIIHTHTTMGRQFLHNDQRSFNSQKTAVKCGYFESHTTIADFQKSVFCTAEAD